MREVKKVFITVKTYPTISEKYDELVCTAGILEDGSWIRLYPLPFRKLDFENRYKKYQWLEVAVERNSSDVRIESHKVLDIDAIKTLQEVKPGRGWERRKEIVLRSQKVYTNLRELIEISRATNLSLAIFKPTKVFDFGWEEVEHEWPEEKLQLLKAKANQMSLFQTPAEVEKEFMIVRKLPYRFIYSFSDSEGKKSSPMIEDWEIGMLYWHCLATHHGDEKKALQDVRKKYLDEFTRTKDLHFFLGTTKQFHSMAPNPFMIVGTFHPPKSLQGELFMETP